MTLLGDFNQTINPLKKNFDYERISEILQPESSVIVELNKVYRSTSDIVEFTRHILNNSRIETIERPGKKPQLIRASDEEGMISKLEADIKDLIDNGMKSIGILCKTAERSKQIHDAIKNKVNASLLTRDDVNFSRGIIVLPVYLAKGLEFDAALVVDADSEAYGLEQDRKIFYTACTRALHRLHLYCSGRVTPLMDSIPQACYETVNV
jgi:DNA helicase-2/ATP-dependent DNA helicase PcrA